MTKQINMRPGASAFGGVGVGPLTSAGNPWAVSDDLANDLVNRGLATMVVVDARGAVFVPTRKENRYTKLLVLGINQQQAGSVKNLAQAGPDLVYAGNTTDADVNNTERGALSVLGGAAGAGTAKALCYPPSELQWNFATGASFFMQMRVKTPTIITGAHLVGNCANGTRNGLIVQHGAGNLVSLGIRCGASGVQLAASSDTVAADTWFNVTVWFDGATHLMNAWLDGKLQPNWTNKLFSADGTGYTTVDAATPVSFVLGNSGDTTFPNARVSNAVRFAALRVAIFPAGFTLQNAPQLDWDFNRNPNRIVTDDDIQTGPKLAILTGLQSNELGSAVSAAGTAVHISAMRGFPFEAAGKTGPFHVLAQLLGDEGYCVRVRNTAVGGAGILATWNGYIRNWVANTTGFQPGSWCLPPVANGYKYKAEGTPGVSQQTSAGPVAWPTVAGQQVVDGAVTWTCYAADAKDVAGYVYQAGDSGYDPRGYIATLMSAITESKAQEFQTMVLLSGHQSDYGSPVATVASTLVNLVRRALAAGADSVGLGITNRFVGDVTDPQWDAGGFYPSVRDQAYAALKGDSRVFLGPNGGLVTSLALTDPVSSIHLNDDGAKFIGRLWRPTLPI